MTDPIILELTKQIARLQSQVDGLIKPEIRLDLISPFLLLPGLVGFWPMSSIQRSTGNVYDLSGQSRTLTYNGNPVYNYSGLVPYIDLDGTGDYLSRADETDLDIIGNEAQYYNKGLTMGGWFWFDNFNSTGNAPGIIGKFDAVGNQKSFAIISTSTDWYFRVSSDGSTNYDATATTNHITGAWVNLVLKFVPSTGLYGYVNGVLATQNLVATPASLFNSTAAFQVGMIRVGLNQEFFDGRASLCFLCANALSDDLISSLFQQTRPAFGV